MRAVAVSRFRTPPELMDLPSPAVSRAEMLVRVEYAGVNPLDWKIADGIFEGNRPHVFPLVLGVDAAGTVEAVGPAVERFRVGDRIFGQFLHDPIGTGTYAEFVPAPEGIGVTRVPNGMKSEEAAALPTAGMTALASLDFLALPPGASLVIVGASGGVGSFATELAAASGIHVTAVARASSAARLRSLGAEEVVDPSGEDPHAAVARTHPSGLDGLLDAMSDRPTFARWATIVRRGGAATTTMFSADVRSLERAGVRGVNVDLQPTTLLLDRLAKDVVDHHLKVPLERRVRLPEAPAALAELRAGRAHGKTVVEV
ncbi:MAG TPA: NADP-dependent oxidoreductase [Thermoplasmata archaeon]|jgi:NADPH:quinone reductase-like Zn-dependent oxidoreductase